LPPHFEQVDVFNRVVSFSVAIWNDAPPFIKRIFVSRPCPTVAAIIYVLVAVMLPNSRGKFKLLADQPPIAVRLSRPGRGSIAKVLIKPHGITGFIG